MITNRSTKTLLISVLAVVVTTVGISASDELRGIESRLTGALSDSTDENSCPAGTTLVAYGTHAVCIDVFESAPGKDCLYNNPASELETEVNLANPKCEPVSEPLRVPWRYVSYTEAAQLCARDGKRLPTNDEWYKVALGTRDLENCVLREGNPKPGNDSICSTELGVINMVGNVWEWMSETVAVGEFAGRKLPASGYVSLVDDKGVVVDTSSEPNSDFGGDYASTKDDGLYGMLRGGFYGSGEDGGLFSQNFAAPLNLTAVGVGFRCVKDVW